MIYPLGQEPEIPDPAQLDLFGNVMLPGFAKEAGEDHNETMTEPVCRSPTGMQITEGNNLSEAQLKLAGSLHRKSRELVSKSYQNEH